MELILDNLPWFILFVGILLFVESAYYLIRDWRDGANGVVTRRMRLLRSGHDKGKSLRRLLRSPRDAVSVAIARAVPALDRLVAQSGMPVTVAHVAVLMIASSITATALFHGLSIPAYAALGAGLLAGLGGPLAVMALKRHRRRRRFQEKLPEALNLIIRSLKAGHPVSVTIGTVAQEMGDPIGTEFGLAVDEMTYGLPLHEALDNMTRRVGVDDLKFVAVAIQIQHQVGGNLAGVLANIEAVVRDRFHMMAKVRAVSAEGRMSGWVIGALPLFVWAALMALRPDYYGAVEDDPLFKTLMIAAVSLLVIGQAVIWRLVNFRI